MNALGKNATAKKYETGGGSAGTGGVGRHPCGYADDTGTPSVNPSGAYTISAPLRLYPTRFNTTSGNDYVSSLSLFDNYSVSKGNLAVVGSTTGIRVTNGGSTDAYIIFGGGYRVNVPAAGYIGVSKVPKAYIGMGTYLYESADAKELWSIEHPFSTSYSAVFGRSVSEQGVCFVKFDIDSSSGKTSTEDFISSKIEASYQIPYYDSSYKKYRVRLALILWIPHNSETFFAYNSIPVSYVPSTTTINQINNITINNNTWNGNIYQDNSTNLTYIYPQYTTINENNETVTNISNNPIIYNNETKQYYTYDSVTNNYYYITYEAPTPSPSPDPDPTPTPEPGGDTSGIMKILQEIKAVLVSGFAGITEKLQNIGVGGSTPETAKPGSSSGNKGQSWWEKLLGKIGDAIVDGLLGAISAVLKLIFKLFTTILGWIIWLVSQVLTLFPFLPPGLGALLIGGVVVCFIIGLIKFIRG